MVPVSLYEDMISKLTDQFSDGNDPDRIRMVGVVFARPNSPFAKTEIIPQLNDWHCRSAGYITFYFVGYSNWLRSEPECVEVEIPGTASWLYSSEDFNVIRKEFESRTSWRYGGGCELILTNAQFNNVFGTAELDFSSAVCCQLDEMKADQAFSSVERFFESIFRFAETSQHDDPTWGFSDSQGIRIAGKAIKRMVLGLLPKGLNDEYKKAEHFIVRNVSSA